MAKVEYARVQNGFVVERLSLDEGVDLQKTFSADFLSSLIPCPKQVKEGWEVSGDIFLAPVANLDAMRQQRLSELSRECEAKIVGGFLSSALGDQHTYPSNIKDQINLMGSVTDSLMPDLPADWATPFWVRDVNGIWSWKMHNVPQIQQAGRDGKTHVVNCQTTLAGLTDLVLSAETSEALSAIQWPSSN
ncbi:hypothetical protein O8B39_17280 [Agrobacterium rhizogenes]|nr:hypothetical protein [Rhizobium rhizogenes]